MNELATCFELAGVSHRYESDRQGTDALLDVNLDLKHGEFVSLLGPSGCGKSTLLKFACGLLSPSSGKVSLLGETAQTLGQVGYMPQQDLLFQWRTVLDNAIIGLQTEGVSKKEARSAALRQFKAFGLEGFENHYPSQLSGDMRQRAALLRTFLVDRPLYVLDEPFGKLDSLTRLSMHRWLTDIWRDRKAAILFVTHDVDEALFLSDRIYVMSSRPGRILESASVDLPRPRNHISMTQNPNVSNLKAKLLGLLETNLNEESDG
ncbi:MAG: ABC transporter ATP-binding protein [Verrucomicrobiota bacterium]